MPKILFNSADELIYGAREHCSTAPEEYRETVIMYFMARYLVATYEARFDQLPIQVWNDLRNGLDHFMRYISHPSDGQKHHINKMRGHIQRAVLDTCKFICHEGKSYIDSLIKQDGVSCLRLVDNGDFYDNIRSRTALATKNFVLAKAADHGLADGGPEDMEVVRSYLEPCFETLNIISDYQIQHEKIEKAARKLNEAEKTGALKEADKSFSPKHLLSHVAGHAIWALLVGLGIWFGDDLKKVALSVLGSTN